MSVLKREIDAGVVLFYRLTKDFPDRCKCRRANSFGIRSNSGLKARPLTSSVSCIQKVFYLVHT